jgi:hypothetical protein
VMPEAYCREIEAYLTRKNDGHLIRIVGPSFERVRSWAERGVPIKVAFQGIDRHFERYYAKGPRRRPVHIDHCEADVLEAFDQWRRAVGVSVAQAGEDPAPARRRQDSLAGAIERAIARLTALRSESSLPSDALGGAVRDLDLVLPAARTARGEARQRLVDRLAAIDGALMAAARAALAAAEVDELRRLAAADLMPFRDRMPSSAWQRSIEAAVDRAIRMRVRLPVLPPND